MQRWLLGHFARPAGHSRLAATSKQVLQVLSILGRIAAAANKPLGLSPTIQRVLAEFRFSKVGKHWRRRDGSSIVTLCNVFYIYNNYLLQWIHLPNEFCKQNNKYNNRDSARTQSFMRLIEFDKVNGPTRHNSKPKRHVDPLILFCVVHVASSVYLKCAWSLSLKIAFFPLIYGSLGRALVLWHLAYYGVKLM